jgi:hypothetical protein
MAREVFSQESIMIIKPGDKIHVIARRNFEGDMRRHFAGEITEASESVVLAKGYVFAFNSRTNQYVRRPEQRTRVVSLVDAKNIINMLPIEANIENITYQASKERVLVVTDGITFTLNIDEFAFSSN